jgi:hypothetical protein
MDRALNTGTAATPYISHGSRRGIAAASGVMTGQNAQEIRDQILAYLAAHEAERALLALGFDGRLAREGDHGVFVYAYLKTASTEP